MRREGGPEHNPTSEDREKRSKLLLRLMTLSRNIEALHGQTVEEAFDADHPELRRELLSTLTADEYFEFIEGINGILRDKEKEDWDMDGVGVTAAGQEVIGKHIFPHHEDKRDILVKTWVAAHQMNEDGRDLEDIGMLLGSMLVETHPFNDGNGRTSRLVYLMTKEGFSKEKIMAVLGEDGRDEFDMALPKIYIDKLFDREQADRNTLGINGIRPDEELPYGQLKFPAEVDEEVRADIVEAGRHDMRIFTAAIKGYLSEHPDISVENIMKMYGERKFLLVQKLLEVLSAEQVSELAAAYWQKKKEYTEGMIDIFAHSDKPEYKIERDGQEMRMIDYFKQRLAEGAMLL